MSLLLAIETSSPRGSLALFRDGTVVAERCWKEDRFRNQHIYTELAALLDEAGIGLEAVDCFAVGRGPGTFSSLRIAISFARAAALPGGAEVYAVSSGEALAAQVLSEPGSPDAVAVVGDARRGALWYTVFERAADGGLPLPPVEWRLASAETFLDVIPADALVATSERERVQSALPEGTPAARTWLKQDRFPEARLVGERVLQRKRAGLASEPLVPLYMHPAVRPAPVRTGPTRQADEAK